MNAHPKIAETVIAIVPLSRLRPGHDHPDADINMRKTYDDKETRELSRSILKEGLIQSLLVCPSKDVPLTEHSPLYVAAGGRRLAALNLLYENGEISGDYPVPVTIECGITPADALGKSMIENDVRVPPHPADRYEAFAELVRMGMNETQIAERFGTTEIRVRRALALGALSPAIRDAWRKGELNEEAARAFTLAPDHKTQDKLYARLKKKNALTKFQIREELRPGNEETKRLLTFVGMDAYRKAGGAVHEDLFEGAHGVSDAALLKAMANDILDRECERLKAKGWSWALPEDRLPADWTQWETTDPLIEMTAPERKERDALMAEARDIETQDPDDHDLDDRQNEIERLLTAIDNMVRERGFNDVQRAKAGCVVRVSYDGALDVMRGVIRPGSAMGDAKTKKSKKSAAEDAAQKNAAAADGEAGGNTVAPPAGPNSPSPLEGDGAAKRRKGSDVAVTLAEGAARPVPSNSAMKWLSECLTDAAAQCVRADPDLALALIICAAAQRGPYKPLCLSVDGRAAADFRHPMTSDKIEDNLATLASRTKGQVLELVSKVAAASLDMTTENASSPPLKHDGVAAICGALGPSLIAELRRSFDLATWFESVPKALALDAILEALGEDHHARAKKLKAKEIAAYAAKNIAGTGWLPEQLRTAYYHFPSPLEGEGKAKHAAPRGTHGKGAPGEG